MTPESELRDILEDHSVGGKLQMNLMLDILQWHRRHKERELKEAYHDIARRYFEEDKNLGQIVHEAGDASAR